MKTQHPLLLACIALVAFSAIAARGQTGPAAARSVWKSAIRVDPTVQEKMLVPRVDPTYPGPAKELGLQGDVVLRALIDKSGRVCDLEYSSGPLLLVQASIDAVSQWQYKQTLLNGRPIAVDTKIKLNFKLPRGFHGNLNFPRDAVRRDAGTLRAVPTPTRITILQSFSPPRS
jgi:TonB family protein